jgi:hypothetical protein
MASNAASPPTPATVNEKPSPTEFRSIQSRPKASANVSFDVPVAPTLIVPSSVRVKVAAVSNECWKPSTSTFTDVAAPTVIPPVI